MIEVFEIDAQTSNSVERDFTPDELAQRKLDKAEAKARQTEADAKLAARESALAKLAALGLSADEIAAL